MAELRRELVVAGLGEGCWIMAWMSRSLRLGKEARSGGAGEVDAVEVGGKEVVVFRRWELVELLGCPFQFPFDAL